MLHAQGHECKFVVLCVFFKVIVMYALLLLVFMQDNVIQAAPRESIADVKAQLKATREELKAANDAIAANRVREAQRERDLAGAIEEAKHHAVELQEERNKIVGLEDRLAATPKQAAASDIMPVLISGLSIVDSAKQNNDAIIQWRIFTSPMCAHCPAKEAEIRALIPLGWSVGNSETSQFRIISMTESQWIKSGFNLPRAELWIEGKVIEAREKFTAIELCAEWNKRHSNYETNLAGVKVGTLGVKSQVEKVLRELQPFLDGGTLNITYTPKSGVVKNYLTITQGSYSLRIPAKTSVNLSMDNTKLAVKFDSPPPQVHIPVRGNTSVNSMTLSPDKFAIQLAWMIDPEWILNDNPSSSVEQDTFGAANKPQMELDEEIGVNDNLELFGEPRSGHWPTVRAAYNRAHPFCEACGTPNDGNVHHVVPFHDNPALECDPSNLIRLCRDDHFNIGHHRNWKSSNPNVRADAAKKLSETRSNPR